MPTRQEQMQELERLEKELSALFISIAEKYKKMSKFHDKWRLDGIQSMIDFDVQKVAPLREKLDARRKEIMDEWSKQHQTK